MTIQSLHIPVIMFVVASSFAQLAAQTQVKVHQIKASSLRIRDSANTKGEVMGSFPRGAYIATNSERQNPETIDGKAGGWVNIFVHSWTGYAFDGFLSEDSNLSYVDLQDCGIENKLVNCNGSKFTFTDKTPFGGAYHVTPGVCMTETKYFYEGHPKRLEKIMKAQSATISVVINRQNQVQQFFATPTPRGGCN